MTLRINPARIAYLRFIVEGYDGLGIITTLDARNGDILIRYPAERSVEMKELLSAISQEIGTQYQAGQSL